MLLSLLDTWDIQIKTWAGGLGPPVETLLRLVLAALAGGLVGIEREVRGRQAGFRTNMLVCLGSSLVMIVSIHFASVDWTHSPNINVNVDPARIAYGVMTGVGFLGAGTILHSKATIRGLTTAAAMWCVAAVGLAIGCGLYLPAFMATLLIVGVLWFLDYLGDFLPKTKYRTLVLQTKYEIGCVAKAVEQCRKAGMTVINSNFDRTADLSTANIQLTISFRKAEEYLKLEQQIETDPRYNVMAVRDS